MSKILGIVAHTLGYGDAGAALIVDGEIQGVVEEERFTRKRYDDSFPTQSISWLLEKAAIDATEIDEIAVHINPLRNIHRRLYWLLRHPLDSALNIGEQAQYAKKFSGLDKTFAHEFGTAAPAIKYYGHHLCHAACAFYTSQFDRAAFLTLDGVGEGVTGMIGIAESGEVPSPISNSFYPHSLGFVYSAVGDHIGFPPPAGPGKIMGLSAYGDPSRFRDLLQNLIWVKDGQLRVDLSYFRFHRNLATPLSDKEWVSEKFARTVGFERRTSESPLQQEHIDLAASLQEVTNSVGISMARHAINITGASDLCIAGGVALNSVMNGKIFNADICENIHVPPAAGDAGNALGAVFLASLARGEIPKRYDEQPYTGPSFRQLSIETALNQRGVSFTLTSQPAKVAAQYIADGKIIGWFQGKMEYGPRALGNRSILANPRNPDIRNIINKKVKHREWFRPFAPSVTVEALPKYFHGPVNNSFMLFVADVREEWRETFPGITHEDGSARVQSVHRERSPLYHQLLSHLGEITQHPLVLNTSFNNQEPIVCTPDDAISCFASTNIDVLIIGNCVVTKSDLPA